MCTTADNDIFNFQVINSVCLMITSLHIITIFINLLLIYKLQGGTGKVLTVLNHYYMI